MTKVSIILPVYNQADHINQIVRSYEESLEHLPCPYELILVVNNSHDDSLKLCRELEKEHPTVCVIHSEKGGWGFAVKLGLSEASGDILCYTNSARTNGHDLLLMVLYALANPGVAIKANRKVRGLSLMRKLGSLLYNFECRALFDVPYWDVNGTPKLFPRSFDRLLHMSSDDDLIDAEFNAICRMEKYPLLEVPILLSTERHGGQSTTNIKSAIRLYIGAFKLRQKILRDYQQGG